MIATGVIETASFVVSCRVVLCCVEAVVVTVGRTGLKQLGAAVVLSWSGVSQMLQHATLAENSPHETPKHSTLVFIPSGPHLSHLTISALRL